MLNNSFSVFWLNFITVGWLVKNPHDHVVQIWIHVVKMFNFLICISESMKIVSLSCRFPADICWCRWMVTKAQYYHFSHTSHILEECYCCLCCCLLLYKMKKSNSKCHLLSTYAFISNNLDNLIILSITKCTSYKKWYLNKFFELILNFNACHKMSVFPRQNILLFTDVIQVNSCRKRI